MAGCGSDDGDYYSDGDWGVEDNGGYFSDDYWEQQEFGNYDNVSESHLGTGRDDNHEEQDDSEGSYDEYKGMKSVEVNDDPGHGVGDLELPGIVIVIPGEDWPQQTMTGGIGKQSEVDEGRCPMTSYEWSSRTMHQDKQTGDYASSMAGYGSDDGDYNSDGDWGVEDNGGYFSDEYWEQQEFGDYDNVSESRLGTGKDDHHEEQDDSEGSYDEYKGTESEEVNDDPGHGVGDLELPGIVIVIPGEDWPQQTMTGGIGKQSGVDGGRHPMTSYEWSSRTRHQDKHTGDYARRAMKHTFTSGDTFKERSTGRVGFKDEYKQSTTVTIGNKGGYSEHHREERFRTVNFGKSSGNGSGRSSSTNKKI